MKDKELESNNTNFLQAQDGEGYSFYEPRQSGEQINLNFVLDGLRKYWYASILVSTLMMAGIAYKIQTSPLIYKSEIQIAIDLKESASLAEKLATTIGSGAGLPESQSTTIETTIQTLMSKTIIQEALDSIPDRELRPSIGSVLANLKITSKKNTSIIFITYNDTNPQRIVATLSALSKAYTNYSITTKKASLDKSINFIDAQLPESRKRLELAAQDVEKFRQKYRFFDPESSTQKLTQYRQEIVVKLNEAKVQYDQAQKQFEELKRQMTAVGLKSDNILSVTVLTQDRAYQDLFRKLNELDLAYNQERLRFNNDNPLVIAAKGKRDQMSLLLKNRARQVLKREVSDTELTNGDNSGGIATNIANKRFELAINLASQAAQYQSSYKIYQQVEAQLAQLPTLQKKYTELQRQYTIYSQELTAFLQKLQELKIADAEQVVPWRLLDPPDLPEVPVPPSVPVKMGLGLLASLLAGVLTALGLKKLDHRIDNPETVKSMVGMPILAMIPRVESLEQVSMQKSKLIQIVSSQIAKSQNSRNESDNNSYWSFIEAIRTLALGIRLTADREENQDGKVIALTSALPKEGKSTITFHTSIALAELGYRVLLVDVDLHKSTISKMCLSSELFLSDELGSRDGLSNALLESDQWQNLIKKSSKFKLDVLLSGVQSINSITLLNSPRFIRLIEEWKKEYDYVIFDTPPIVGISDTRLIATLVDGIVYVVGLNIAQRQMIDQAVDIISSIKTPVLGLAINRVDNHYSGYHQYYHYYQQPRNLPEEATSTIQVLKGSPK